MSQRLLLKKQRTWETFQKDRLEKMSDTIISQCILSKSRLDEFLYSEYDGLDTEKFILHIKSLPDDDRDDELFSILQGWLDWIVHKFNLNHGSAKNYFSRLNKYLWYRRIKITSHDIKDELEWPEDIREELYAPSDEEFSKIVYSLSWRNQGYCIGLASGCMRPVELMGTQKKHYTLMPNGKFKLEIPYYLTKKRISRTIFFSKEFTPYVAKRLKKLEDENFVWTYRKELPQSFLNRYSHLKEVKAKIKAIKRFATDMTIVVRKSFNRKLEDLELDMRYEATGHHKITLYSFRARFITKALKILDGDIVHAIAGHGAYLQTYQRRTDLEKLELFEEVEHVILVDTVARKQAELEKEKSKNHKLEAEIEKRKDVEIRLEQLEAEKDAILKVALEKEDKGKSKNSELEERVKKMEEVVMKNNFPESK